MKIRKFFNLPLTAFVLFSFSFNSVPNTASQLNLNYSKPNLYTLGQPYIKYFKDRALDNSTGFSGLSRSFQLYLGGHTQAEEDVINYAAMSYDQSILGRILLENNDTAILDTYVNYSKQLTDPGNPLFYTNYYYNVKNGPFRAVRILGRDLGGWWDTWDWSVDTGSSAYLLNYALSAYRKTQNPDYLSLATVFGDYLLNMQDSDGGVRMGPIEMWHPSGPDFYWNTKSTEQNENALYALENLYEVTQDAKYLTAVNSLKSWLKNMYNKQVHLFHSAAHFNGTVWEKTDFGYVATDVTAFAPLEMMFNDTYFGSTQTARDAEVDAMFGAIEERSAFFDNELKLKLFRFSVSQTGEYGSVEWSAQMALAYLRAAQIYLQRDNLEKARNYLDKYNALIGNIEAYFSSPANDPQAKIAPYASYLNGAVAGNVPTGTGYYTYNCQAALASAFYAFAKAGYDPIKLDGGLGIPEIEEPDITPPTTPIVIDEGQYTENIDQLYASWVSSDNESGIAEYQYRITQDAPTSSIVIRNWTSTQTPYVTAGALSLTEGKTYYFSVKAKNGAGLWSEVGYSDGITVKQAQPNQPPVLPEIGNKTVNLGETISITITGYDPDGDILTYSAVNLPEGALFNSYLRTFVWKPTELGQYQVTFIVSDGELSDSETITIAVLSSSELPAAPSNLVASAVNSKQVKLTWTDNSSDERGFRVERGLSEAGPFTLVGIAAANTTTFNNYGLSPNTTYYYRVKAYRGIVHSLPSNIAIITTPEVPPKAPNLLRAKAISPVLAELSWRDNSTDETGFKIERSTGFAGPFIQIASVGANLSNYSDTTVAPDTYYYYRVKAYRGALESTYSNLAFVRIPDFPPDAPTNLVATALSDSKIKLTWQDNSNNEHGFRIERSTSASGPFASVGIAVANTTTYTNFSLSANTTYYYRVRAYRFANYSDYSNVASATTLEIPPKTPSLLKATAISSHQVNLTWQDNSTDEAGFKIERGMSFTGPFTEIASVGANTSAYSDLSVGPKTFYYYRIKAYRGIFESAYSNVALVMTPDVTPSAPTNLKAEFLYPRHIKLTWQDNSNNEQGFKIERALSENGPFISLGIAGPNVTTYTNYFLTSQTAYYYRVSAYRTILNSEYSNIASITIP